MQARVFPRDTSPFALRHDQTPTVPDWNRGVQPPHSRMEKAVRPTVIPVRVHPNGTTDRFQTRCRWLE